MRPFVFFSFFSAATFVVADTQELIDNTDKRISYSDGWKFKTVLGVTLSVNDKDSGTASLSVHNATSIAVRIFVEKPDQVVQISLDSKNYEIMPTLYQQPAWTTNSLDPSVIHDLVITKRNPNGQSLALDSILVTYHNLPPTTVDQATATAAPTPTVPNQLNPPTAVPAAAPPSTQAKSMSGIFSSARLPSDSSPEPNTNDASSETNARTDSDGSDVSSRITQSTAQSDPLASPSFTSLLIPEASTTSSPQQQNTESVLSGAKLAAVIFACIAAPALVIAGIILYRRRMLSTRKAASTAYLEWMAAHGQVPPRPVFSPPPFEEKFNSGEALTRPESPISDSAKSYTMATAL